MNSKTILVTGCAGFIGSNFVNTFQKKFPKTKIVGIDNLSTGKHESINPDITFYKGSINDPIILEKIFSTEKPEYVFHFAALPRVSFSVEEPAKTTLTNVYGTTVLLEKSRDHKVKRFIFSSSSAIYGGAKKLPTKESENPPKPISPYALQKYVGELLMKNFSALYDLDTVCLRYFNVYGPGQYGDSAYSTVISAWLEGLYFPTKKNLFVEGDGKQSRDFCFVDNVVQANIKAMQSKKKFLGEEFNIAHGERTTLIEVKNAIEKLTGQKLTLEKKPSRKGDVRDTHADISKALKWFGYKPTTTFEEGLEKTIAWFEKRKKG